MNFEKLTKYIDSLNEEYGIPAADCKITMNHEIVYRHMAGYSDYDNKTPLTENTLFRLFSATKLVTMTAVLQQIERGNLALYDELSTYLPEFNQIKVAYNFESGHPVKWPKSSDPCYLSHNTIRIIDLMTMTAGLSYDTFSEEIKEIREKSNDQASTREVVAEIAKMPLVYEPRTRYSYGLCHDVLAAVVEVTSGQKFSQYLKDNIFDPLDIEDFYFHWHNDKNLSDRICAIYMGTNDGNDIKPDDGIMSNGFKCTPKFESGGAGLAGTVDSYSLFIDALANGGIGANGNRILSEDSVKLFTLPYTKKQMSKDFAMSGKVGYEYGLGVRVLVDDKASKSPLGEFGWDGAAGAYALVDPFNHISIFYAQHIIDFPKVYDEIHPKIRDLAYECMNITK